MHFSQRYIPQPCKQVLKSFELTSQCYLMSVPSYILCHLTLAFSYNLAAFWWQQCSKVNNKKYWKGFQFLRLSVFKGFKMKKKNSSVFLPSNACFFLQSGTILMTTMFNSQQQKKTEKATKWRKHLTDLKFDMGLNDWHNTR